MVLVNELCLAPVAARKPINTRGRRHDEVKNKDVEKEAEMNQVDATGYRWNFSPPRFAAVVQESDYEGGEEATTTTTQATPTSTRVPGFSDRGSYDEPFLANLKSPYTLGYPDSSSSGAGGHSSGGGHNWHSSSGGGGGGAAGYGLLGKLGKVFGYIGGYGGGNSYRNLAFPNSLTNILTNSTFIWWPPYLAAVGFISYAIVAGISLEVVTTVNTTVNGRRRR